MRRGHVTSGVGGTRSRHGSVIRYACLTASAARRIQASGVIFAHGPTSIFSRHLVEQQCAACHGVRGDALLLRAGIFRTPVSRRLLGRDCAQRPAHGTKGRSHFELDARRAIASYRGESGRTGEARSGDDAHLPPIVERLWYGDECLFECCAKFRSASAPPAPVDSGTQYQACGCGGSDWRPLDGLHLRRLLDSIYPGWDETVDWSLLLERESFFYLVLSAAATLCFLLLRVLFAWYADSRLRIPRFRLREHAIRAGAAFFSPPEIKE